jgi:hypothetical protein
MRSHVPLLGAAALTLLLSGGARADRPDPAAWFPARTIAYLEVNQPAQLAKEVDALFKGSALDNLPNLLAAFREKNPVGERYYYGPRVLEMLALMVGPEARAEFARTQGAAVAITGVGKTGQPEVVGVILPGDSHLPALFMRAMFFFDSELRTVAEVEGVRVYQERRRVYEEHKYGPRVEPLKRISAEPKVKYEQRGPVIAMLPRVIILGSSTDAVGDVIRRIKGKQSGDSLAGVKGFKDAGKLRDRPGLFGYADVPALVNVTVKFTTSVQEQVYRARELMEESQIRMLEERRKFAKDREKQGIRDGQDYDAEIRRAKERLDGLKKGAAARKAEAEKVAKLVTEQLGALRSAAGSLSLQDGALGLEITVRLDPEHKSMLPQLLPGKKADLEMLHYVPPDCSFALAKGMPASDQWWPKLLELVDTVAGASGSKQPPSKAVKALEAKLGFTFGKDLFDKIKGGAIAVPPARVDIPRDGVHIPLLVIEAKDADAAKSLGALVPRLVALFRMHEVQFGHGKVRRPVLVGAFMDPDSIAKLDLDKLPRPVTETVDGQNVYSLAGGDLPWGTAVQYGVRGRFLVIGQDPKFIAGALSGGARKKGLLGEARVAQAVKGLNDPVAVGVWSLGQSLADVVRWDAGYRPRSRYYGYDKMPPPVKGEKAEPKRDELNQRVQKLAQGYGKEVAKEARALEQAVESLPPVVLSVTRRPDRLTFQMRQAGLKVVLGKVLGILVNWQLERGAYENKMADMENRVRKEFERPPRFEKEVPVPPPPPPPPPKP